MIYFDNAATGGFKPSAVYTSAENAIRFLNVNPGRSGHRLSVLGEEFIFRTRSYLSKSFNNGRADRVIFTKNCTEALNTAIFGLAKPNSEIVTTITEHNSVLRPIYALAKKIGITIKFAQPKEGFSVKKSDVLELVNEKTSLVIINAVSNVTGEKNEFEGLGKMLKCPLVVDMAQAAGHIEINMQRDGINAIAVAGHKGLNSIQGVGALIFDDKTEIAPLTYGGSGTESFEEIPTCYPELLESGTLNLPAICSLYDGADYALSNLKINSTRLTKNTKTLISELNYLGIKTYSFPNPCGIVSFELTQNSIVASEIYSNEFDIALRGGFHCAPLMHKFLNTSENGLIRISLSPQNSEREIEKFLKATKSII